jgi:hypothetical protein
MPKKKSKKHPLTKEDKKNNQKLSGERAGPFKARDSLNS